MKSTPSFPLRRLLLPLEIGLFLGLSGVAFYLWTTPQRTEKRLATASFSDLVAISKREPENPRVFYYLGVRLHQLGRVEEAKAAFAQSAGLDKDAEDTWLAWAATSGELTGDQEAFGILTAYSKAHPRSVRAHLALATLYQEKNSFLRALDEEKAVLGLDPKNTQALRMIGTAGLNLEKYADAEDALRKVIDLEPKDWHSYTLLGSVLESQHKYPEAIAAYQKAASLAPTEAGPLIGQGRAQLKVATDNAVLSQAIGALKHAVSLAPDNANAAVELGKGYLRAKRYTDAHTILQKAEKLAPQDVEVAFELKTVAEQQGDRAATQYYDQRHRKLQSDHDTRYNLYIQVWQHPQDANLRLQYARLCAQQGDFSAAADSYQRLLALKPDGSILEQARSDTSRLQREHPEVFMAKSIQLPMPAAVAASQRPTDALLKDAADLIVQRRYPEAEKAYAAIIARDPKSAAAVEGLGLTFDTENKVDEAFTTLNHALQLDPSRIKAQYRLAGIYFESGFPEEATKRMEKVVAQVTDNADYWHALGLGAVTVGTANRLTLAQKAFGRAATLAPGNAIYLRDEAIAEEKNRDFKNAETHYRQALKLAPDEVTILQALGNFLAEQQTTPARLSEAEQLLRQANAFHPGNPLVLASLGGVRLSQGNAKEAVKYLEDALERSSGDTTAWYRLAQAYQKLGNSERSKYCMNAFREITSLKTRLANTEEAVRMHLKDPQKRLDLARLYATSGQYAKAINQYQMAISLDSTQTSVKTELDGFVARLKANGQMPEMSKFNGMLLASTAQQKINQGFSTADKAH